MDSRETTTTLQTKNLTQIWGIYKIFSKKRFLDSMDLRETTITLQTKISRKSGESIKFLLKRILRFA